jgi:hypothetical protein
MTIMKTTSLIFAWCICFFCTAILADSESLLPTSAANIDVAANAAQSVMVCRLTDLGWVDFRGPGVTAYDEAKFDVITIIKGEPISKIVCSLLVLGHSINATEKAPVVGESYIVMGDSKEGKFTLQKLLTATPDNIAKVRHILSKPVVTVGDSTGSETKTLPSTTHPEVNSPPTRKKVSEARTTTTTPSGEPASSTPWGIIVVLTVAAVSLLWLLVKKRK